jgi:hypothetical protein
MPPHRMRTTYAFNSLGQMRKSHTPDGGDKKILYTSKDQVRLSQDARQVVHGDWAYVKYDNLGRTVESGLLVQPNISIAAAALDDPNFPDRSVFTLRDKNRGIRKVPYIVLRPALRPHFRGRQPAHPRGGGNPRRRRGRLCDDAGL